jgi:hypothetical protein
MTLPMLRCVSKEEQSFEFEVVCCNVFDNGKNDYSFSDYLISEAYDFCFASSVTFLSELQIVVR